MTTETNDLAVIRSAIEEGETVPVRIQGQVIKIRLRIPDADAVPRVRSEMPDEDADPRSGGFGIGAAAIRETVFGDDGEQLTQAEAGKLLLIAGGEMSDLGQAAMRLCGVPLADEDKEPSDRPTS